METMIAITRRLSIAAAAAVALVGGFSSIASAQTELTFWTWRQEDRAAYQTFFQAFEKANPGIKVRFEGFEPANYQTILSTALAGGRGPDVMQVRAYGNLESIAKPGYLMALDKTNAPETANFPDSALAAESLRADGKVYALPFASQTMLVVYNTELFTKHGVTPPQSWDELVALCKALKAKGVTPFANGTATAWQNETIVQALLSSLLGKGFEADLLSGKADFTDPRFVGALTKLNELKDYFAPNFSGIDYASSQQLFATGSAAMFAGGSYEVAAFQKQNPRLKLGVFASPPTKAGEPPLVAVFYDGGYAVNARTEKKEAALKLVRWLGTPEFGTMLSGTLQNVSPIKGVRAEAPAVQQVMKLNESAMSYLMLVHFRYQEPSGSVLLQAGVQKMLAGQTTPAEVGAEITKGIATYYAPFKK
jgi:raffinose/stachyose/melibiose transport system substrate-binding protein